MSRETLCGFVIVKSIRYKGWDGAGLANVASDIAKTVLSSCKTWRYNTGLFSLDLQPTLCAQLQPLNTSSHHRPIHSNRRLCLLRLMLPKLFLLRRTARHPPTAGAYPRYQSLWAAMTLLHRRSCLQC